MWIDHRLDGRYEYFLSSFGIFLRIRINMSDSVPMGHTVAQYIRPKMNVSINHASKAPMAVAPADRIICVFSDTAAIGCTCGPIIRYAVVAIKKSAARNMRKILICLTSS